MSDTAHDDTREPDDAGREPDDDARDTGREPDADTGREPDGDGDDGGRSSDATRRARSEARKVRERLKAAEGELAELRKQTESDTQRAQREHKAAEARAEQAETRARELEVQVAAGRLGVRPDAVDLVAREIDWDEVDRDDPKAVEAAIKAVVKARPYLSAREGAGGLDGGKGRGAGAKGEGSPTDLIRRLAGR